MGPSRCGSGAGIFAGARRQTSWLPKRPAGRVDKGRSVQVEPKCQAQVLGVSLTGGARGQENPCGRERPESRALQTASLPGERSGVVVVGGGGSRRSAFRRDGERKAPLEAGGGA